MNYKSEQKLKEENEQWATYLKNLEGRKPNSIYVRLHAERVAYFSGAKK